MALVFFLGGAAALSWQVIWLHQVSLSIGGSAQAMALTVATAMVGMTVGALVCGDRLKNRTIARPIFLYGCFELIIGLTGLLPGLCRSSIAAGDASIYAQAPWLATPFTLVAVALTIGPASLVMGATIPVFGLVAQQAGRPLSQYYGWNTAGAASGALGVAFLLIPALGMSGASFSLTAIHLSLAAVCFLLSRSRNPLESKTESVRTAEAESDSAGEKLPARPRSVALVFAFVTGLTSFVLEVAWFRSLRAAWLSTTDTFAILLFCFLVALAAGALLAPRVRRIGLGLPGVLGIAAVLVLLVTPVIERFDLIQMFGGNYLFRSVSQALMALLVLGPPILMIGISLPTLLDEVRKPRDWALLYGWNTLGAVAGSIGAAWVLLPMVGFAKTAWIAGGLLGLTAVWRMKGRGRWEFGLFAVVALAFAFWFESGIGERRVQGTGSFVGEGRYRTLATRSGPDVTTSVIGFEGGRALYIDGYAATAQLESQRGSYMDAMGRLPMLLHPEPRDALVICFGTGQTAHGVRDENPERLTLVDLNPAVFRMAKFFDANRGVIDDDRVRVRIMDGRAWLRRTSDGYDVITLEPMPPFFAGSNGLYSTGFYRQAEARLKPGGYMAQWFPIHLLTPSHAEALAAAFVEVFPDAVLWIDRHSVGRAGVPEQGILIGRKEAGSDGVERPRFWLDWPGFDRLPDQGPRSMTREEAQAGVYLTPAQLQAFVAGVEPVTDDNQRLSYGKDRRHQMDVGAKALILDNYRALESARSSVRPSLPAVKK